MNQEIKFIYKKTNELIPYCNNSRTHSEEQVMKLCSSIKEFGFISPVVIDKDGGILAGHGRVLAAKKLGLDDVPCVIEEHLSEAQKKAYIIADNRLALDADWDDDLLRVEMEFLKENDFDIALTGFDDDEIDGILGDFEAITADDFIGGDHEDKKETRSDDDDDDDDKTETDDGLIVACPKCGHRFKN